MAKGQGNPANLASPGNLGNQESLGDLCQKRLRGHLPKVNLKSWNRKISSIELRFYKMKFLAKLIKDKSKK